MQSPLALHGPTTENRGEGGAGGIVGGEGGSVGGDGERGGEGEAGGEGGGAGGDGGGDGTGQHNSHPTPVTELSVCQISVLLIGVTP